MGHGGPPAFASNPDIFCMFWSYLYGIPGNTVRLSCGYTTVSLGLALQLQKREPTRVPGNLLGRYWRVYGFIPGSYALLYSPVSILSTPKMHLA